MFEKFSMVLKDVLGKLISRDETVVVYVYGSYARRDLHRTSDIDMVALMRGEGIYGWERREREGVVVSINLCSLDVMERMLESDPWTIVGLQDAEILYDPKELVAGYRDRATLSDELWRGLVEDSFDDARSNLGRAERALEEGDLISAMLCLRESSKRLCEMYIYESRRIPRNLRHLWKEYEEAKAWEPFRNIFLEVQGLKNISRETCKSAICKIRSSLESSLAPGSKAVDNL